jgi:Domain of unknown function (DUF5655)
MGSGPAQWKGSNRRQDGRPPGRPMANIRDWQDMMANSARLLEERTGESVGTWNLRIRRKGFKDEESLRSWLTEHHVTGYAQDLLVMERFGYPDFLTATAKELIDGQYADRPRLRPILDAILEAVEAFGDLTIQARKTYVSLVSPRRTFARVQPTTKDRVDLALRLEGQKPGGRLRPSKIQETMAVQIGLTSPEDFDSEARRWLRRAYEENR